MHCEGERDRHRLAAGKGEADCFLTLWFNDRTGRPGQPPQGLWTVAARPHRRAGGVAGYTGGVEFAGDTFLPPPRGGYHTLAVEVRPGSAAFFFDDRPLPAVPMPLSEDAEGDFADAAKLIPGSRSDFSPAGWYGLVVLSGTCAFRSATVKQLPGP